ncbi:ClpP family protease [Pseudactinotalea sp.]|uniref:ClpP family protease n=1 Tax=Pseudactinotalea sp. TaxID=1926260 RepID=UPI003B3BCC09
MPTLDDRLIENLMQHRILVLAQQVDDDIGRRLTSQLLLLAAEDPRADITLLINSPGGSVSAGLGIYDTMRMIGNDVATVATGMAASMGQFLLSAGTPGKRYAQPHARILMHQGSAGLQGSPIDIAIQAQNLDHTNEVMTRLTAEHTGQSVETVHRDSDRDRWFTAEEALEYGFVDAIVAGPDVLRLGARRRAGVLA